MIPKIVHRIWFEGSPQMDVKQDHYWETWKNHHPDWEFITWDKPDFPLVAQQAYDAIVNIGAKADVFRYEILNRYGGVYIDTDVSCVQPIDDLIAPTTAFCAKLGAGAANCIMGSEPGHAAIATLLAQIRDKRSPDEYREMQNFHVPMFTGFDIVHRVFAGRPDATMFESMIMGNPRAAYARHHQSGYWQNVKLEDPPVRTAEEEKARQERRAEAKRRLSIKKAIKSGAHVVKQTIKMAAGVGMVPDEVQQERERTCLDCDYGKPCWPAAKEVCCGALTDAITEGETETCGCVVGKKTKMADESCPYKKWGKWEPVKVSEQVHDKTTNV